MYMEFEPGRTWRAFDAMLPEDFAAVGDDG
jgi:hypothetical protein